MSKKSIVGGKREEQVEEFYRLLLSAPLSTLLPAEKLQLSPLDQDEKGRGIVGVVAQRLWDRPARYSEKEIQTTLRVLKWVMAQDVAQSASTQEWEGALGGAARVGKFEGVECVFHALPVHLRQSSSFFQTVQGNVEGSIKNSKLYNASPMQAVFQVLVQFIPHALPQELDAFMPFLVASAVQGPGFGVRGDNLHNEKGQQMLAQALALRPDIDWKNYPDLWRPALWVENLRTTNALGTRFSDELWQLLQQLDVPLPGDASAQLRASLEKADSSSQLRLAQVQARLLNDKVEGVRRPAVQKLRF